MKRLAFMISKNIPKDEQESFSGRGSVNHNDLIYLYCKNIESWPESWEIAEEDVVIGLAITDQFKLFLIDRIGKGSYKKTIRNNSNFLWALGGELIRTINEDDSDRQLSARDLILKYIDDSGGPYWRHARDEI